MKNAHLRFGKMSFSKMVGKASSNFSLTLDRFIGERLSNESPRAHFVSVFGSDAQVAGVNAIISEAQPFSVEGPGLSPLTVTMGKDAKCYRASIQLSTSKRPLRHLIAVSEEFGAQVSSESAGRTLLADASPDYLWASIAQIFGLPALPEWADWFYRRLNDNLAINRIYGLGCCPVLVTGTKDEFMQWLSEGIRRSEIQLPDRNGPILWPSTTLNKILLPSAENTPELNPSIL